VHINYVDKCYVSVHSVIHNCFLLTVVSTASCDSPAGMGANRDVAVTVGNQTSDSEKLWSYLGISFFCL
jgi:hypothetical protein